MRQSLKFILILFIFITGCNPAIASIPTATQSLPISIYAPDCDQMVEPTGSSVSLSASNAETNEISEIEWSADRGIFKPSNSQLTTYLPGAPGPVEIRVTIHFRDGRVYTPPALTCKIIKSLYTVTPTPVTPTITSTSTITPTFTFTPSPTSTITLTPAIPTATFTPISTDTPTPSPTPSVYQLINCADKGLWIVDQQDQKDVSDNGNGCANFEYMRMYVHNGITIQWPESSQPQSQVAYNIYFTKRIIAPTTISFKLNIYEMKTLPKRGSDVSIFAGFVNGSDTLPNWIIGGQPSDSGQGSFAILRLAGTDVRVISNSSTKYLMYQNWVGDYGNVTKKFTADNFAIEFLLKYKKDGLDIFWKPEGEKDFQPLVNNTGNGLLYKPDPAYFAMGYILPKESSLVAWITGITIAYGAE